MALKLDDGLAIKETIQIESPQATVDVMHLDLASLKSVKTFADEYKGLNILYVSQAG
jgi:WW domain-containing oxidoreductase